MSTAWILDGFVILSYFVIVISIGLYKGRGDRTMEAFAVGDRNIPWWAVLASILAAEISAATFLGAPGEGYALRNFTYAQLAIGTILARVIVSFVFIKPYYDYRVDLRISESALRDADEKWRIGSVRHHSRAGERDAALRRGGGARAGV